jgi:hypothetical protein
LSGLDFDDSALQADSYGMGPVIDAKFGEHALDVAFDRFLRREVIGNQLVGISGRRRPLTPVR